MDFYKDFPERSDAGTATTPDGGIVAGSDKLNDNDYTMVGANGTGSNSQGKGYKVKFLSIWNYIKNKLLTDGYYNKYNLNNSSSDFKSRNNSVYGNLRVGVPDDSQINDRVHAYTDVENQWAGRFTNVAKEKSNGLLINAGRTSSDYVARFRSADTSKELFSVDGDGNAVFLGAIRCYRLTQLAPQSLAASYIAERYSIDEEQSLTRRMIANDPTVVEQFEAYNAYCEECKVKAKEELSNKPQVLPADELNNQTI